MSEEQQKLVTDNINLIFYFIHKKGISMDEVDIGYIALCKAAKTFKQDANIQFSTYALRVISNAYGNIYRKTKKTPTIRSLDEEIFNNGTDAIYLGDTISGTVITGISPSLTELMQNVTEFISTLEGNKKDIYLLSISGMTQLEISKRLNISQASVSRALGIMRNKFIMKYYRNLTASEIIDNIKEELYGKEY